MIGLIVGLLAYLIVAMVFGVAIMFGAAALGFAFVGYWQAVAIAGVGLLFASLVRIAIR